MWRGWGSGVMMGATAWYQSILMDGGKELCVGEKNFQKPFGPRRSGRFQKGQAFTKHVLK